MRGYKEHWEKIYNSKRDNEVSWFQEKPETSVTLVERCSSGNKEKSVIDIGGGNSLLVSELVKRTYSNLSVLDISKRALERNCERIPDAPVKWIESNVLECELLMDIDIWHDRAVFHFLTDKKDILKYVEIVTASIIRNGYLILGTFAESGPEKCSGLLVTKYSETKFRELFRKKFELVECFEEVHHTPFDTEQNFIWGVFRRD